MDTSCLLTSTSVPYGMYVLIHTHTHTPCKYLFRKTCPGQVSAQTLIPSKTVWFRWEAEEGTASLEKRPLK